MTVMRSCEKGGLLLCIGLRFMIILALYQAFTPPLVAYSCVTVSFAATTSAINRRISSSVFL